METEKGFAMKFAKVYPLLVQKAERKGRAAQEVHEATCWLTGYSEDELLKMTETDILMALSLKRLLPSTPTARSSRAWYAACGRKMWWIR